MIPRGTRLLRKDFPKEGGKKYQFTYGSIRVYPAALTQGAVVVSKKVFKTAVKRNRARRRIYAALAPILAKRTKPCRIVIYPGLTVLDASFAHIKETLSHALPS